MLPARHRCPSIIRPLIALLLVLSAAGLAPAASSAASNDSFTSKSLDFTVSWNASVWTGTDGTGDLAGGVTLDSDTSTVVIGGFADAGGDINGCISRRANQEKKRGGVSNFKQVNSGFDKVDAPNDAVGALYTYTQTSASGGKSDQKVIYIECRPGNGHDVLRITFLTFADSYASAFPGFKSVYESIELTGAQNGGDPTPAETATAGSGNSGGGLPGRIGRDNTPTATPEKSNPTATATEKSSTTSKPVLKGNVYTGANKSYTVTWDESIWNDVTAIAPDGTGYEGVDINSDQSIGSVEAIPADVTPQECVTQTVSGMGTTDGFSNVAEAPDLDKPNTASGAAGEMVTFTLTTDTGSVDIARYIECRTLIKGDSVLRIELAATSDNVNNVIPSWNDLLGGVKIAKSGSTTAKATATAKPKTTPKAKATKTPTPRATSSSGGNGAVDNADVSGNTFTSPAFGFTFTWPDGYVPVLASGDDTGDVIAVSDGTSTTLIFSKSTSDGTTVKSCLAAKEKALKTSTSITNVQVATDQSNAELRGETATSAYVIYTYTSTSDNTDDVEYLSCEIDPTASYVIDFTFITPASDVTQTSAQLQAMLDSITFP